MTQRNPKDINQSTRRQFLSRTAAGSAAAIAGSSLIATGAIASDLPTLTEDDPIAVALGYKADATQSQRSDAGQLCSNCRLYTDKGNGMGLCSAIPNKLVAGDGWCKAWVTNA